MKSDQGYNSTIKREIQVGQKIREIRTQTGLSLRSLSERSGLNVNTLSLIENGKSSPSVSTLQQLSQALDTPIAVFFETEPDEKHVVFTRAGQRPGTQFGSAQMENLGKDFAGHAVQPFLVTLLPGNGSGDRLIVHTGYEFVYCISGSVHYRIDGVDFQLEAGDSLVFEAHRPHCWENAASEVARILLILYPTDSKEIVGGRHF